MTTSRFDLRDLRDRDELVAFGTRLSAEIKSDDVSSLAAAVSFKIVLALFPAMLAAVAIFALVTNRPEELDALLDNLPTEVTAVFQDQLEEFIEQAASGTIAVTGIVVGLWAATSAAFTLNKALSRAYDEDEERKLVAGRVMALAVTIALLVALIAISVLLVAGDSIENRILSQLPVTETARASLDVASTFGRYVAAILLLMVLFAFIYWIGPDFEERPHWRWITPGAALAVITWLVASALFGWYVANFGSYTDTNSPYGALGGAIVFMLWLQLSMFALLLGAEVNQVLVVRARRRSATAVDTSTAGSMGEHAAGAPTPAERDDRAVGPYATTMEVDLRAATTPAQRDDRAVDPNATTMEVDVRAGTPATGRPASSAAGHTSVTDGGRPAGRPAHAAGSSRGNGAADVRAHDSTDQPSHRNDEPPVATLVGAGVAAVSSIVGLVGLLRRLRA